MTDLMLDDFIPLTRKHIALFAPSKPGEILLTVRLANDAHHPVFQRRTANMRNCLGDILDGYDPSLSELLKKFPCFFSVRHLSVTESDDDSSMFDMLHARKN